METVKQQIIIVTPIYNDWESFQHLVAALYALTLDASISILQVIAVNDGSSDYFQETDFQSKLPITLLNLSTNMGHQRAVSVGLSYVNAHFEHADMVVVMDSDGEDKPEDIPKLIAQAYKNDLEKIIFAKRKKRKDGLFFKFFYRIYKLIFYTLTSQRLDFGNYSCIPHQLLFRVVSIPEIWNHYSGGIIKSKIPYVSVGTDRGHRYHGDSKMNFQSLILHGLSSISIYLDLVSVRLLIGSMVAVVLTVIFLLLGIILPLFTSLHVPGWSSLVVLSMVNILAIIVLTTFLILLFQLNQKNNVTFPPRIFYKDFILSVTNLNPR